MRIHLLSLLAVFLLLSSTARGLTLLEEVFDYPVGGSLPPVYFSSVPGLRGTITPGLTHQFAQLRDASLELTAPGTELERKLSYGIPVNNRDQEQTATIYISTFIQINSIGGFGDGISGVAVFNEADPQKQGFLLGTISTEVDGIRRESPVIGVGADPTGGSNSNDLAFDPNLNFEEGKAYFLIGRFDADLSGREGALRGYLKFYDSETPLPRVEPEEWDLTILRDKQWPLTERNKILDRVQLFRGNTATRTTLDEVRIVTSFSEVIDPVRIPEAKSTSLLLLFLTGMLGRSRRRRFDGSAD